MNHREQKAICALLVTLPLLLLGCNESSNSDQIGSGGQNSQRPADLPGNLPARASTPAGVGCGWQFVSDINTTNVAFPDESAQYWVAVLPHLPGARLRINGRFGHMRYFSYNVYDPIIRPVDAIGDFELIPDGDHANPFINPAAPLGGSYTAYVEFTPKPDEPAANTIYSGGVPAGGSDIPNPLGTGIIYRSYVPEDGYDFDGGVGLPILTLETAEGDQDLAPFADCEEPLLPNLGGLLPDPGVNDLLLESDAPDPILGLANVPTARLPPKTTVFYGLPNTAANILGNALGIDLDGPSAAIPVGGGGGFLSNVHNDYATIAFSRHFGTVYTVRARAPTWRGASNTPWESEQLRYWSICQNEFATQRYVACARDDQMAFDSGGFFTVVVSDPADRPEWATAENGITWLPWGPFPDGLIIYRHMLPDLTFVEAIQNVDQGVEPADIMIDYKPVGAYCYPEQLETEPSSAQELFNACLDATLTQGEQTGILPSVLPGGLTP